MLLLLQGHVFVVECGKQTRNGSTDSFLRSALAGGEISIHGVVSSSQTGTVWYGSGSIALAQCTVQWKRTIISLFMWNNMETIAILRQRSDSEL